MLSRDAGPVRKRDEETREDEGEEEAEEEEEDETADWTFVLSVTNVWKIRRQLAMILDSVVEEKN